MLIIDFGGKRKLINIHQYSDTEKITTYTLGGIFTDNLANYGAKDNIVVTWKENKKIVNIDFSTMWEYQNLIKVYFRGRRGNSDEDTGIGKVVIIGVKNRMTRLIDTKCNYRIKILNENVFGVRKCELSNDAFKTLKVLER